ACASAWSSIHSPVRNRERDREPVALSTWLQMPALLSNVVLKRKKWVGGLRAHGSPPCSQAGVLGSQPPVPVIALTGDHPAGPFSRRIASQIETDGLAAAVCFVGLAYT